MPRRAASTRLAFSAIDADRFFATFRALKAEAGDEGLRRHHDLHGKPQAVGRGQGPPGAVADAAQAADRGQDRRHRVGLPVKVRASLIPMAALHHDGGDSLLLVSPLAPQMVVAADYGRAGRPDLSLVNLANARTGGAQ
ncbi:MAG: hypothetical protein WDN06_14440 [Asticcacaulis sp.]